MTGYRKLQVAVVTVGVAVGVVYSTGSNPSHRGTTAGAVHLPGPTKTSGCQVRGPLPDPACTPGVALRVHLSTICKPGYSAEARSVTSATKRKVYAEYGIASHTPGEYEIDHLIPLELGGSNAVGNLWPEAASPVPGYHEKDPLEGRAHRAACSGAKDLKYLQRHIAQDWQSLLGEVGP